MSTIMCILKYWIMVRWMFVWMGCRFPFRRWLLLFFDGCSHRVQHSRTITGWRSNFQRAGIAKQSIFHQNNAMIWCLNMHHAYITYNGCHSHWSSNIYEAYTQRMNASNCWWFWWNWNLVRSISDTHTAYEIHNALDNNEHHTNN